MSSTILTSIITSIIVSIFTFIIGLKAGKNQADRSKLKETYRTLATYFKDLLECVKCGSPKQWEHFSDKNFNYITPLGNMIKDGTDIDLSQKVTKDIKEVENDAMRFGYYFKDLIINLTEIAVTRLNDCSIEPVEIKEYEISSKINGKSSKFFEKSFGIIILKDEIEKVCSRLNNDPELGISFGCKKNDKNYRINIYAGSVKNNPADFLTKLHTEIVGTAEVKQILEKRIRIIKLLEKKLKQLKRRTRDPHPLWETFGGAFLDLFKG